MEQRVSWQQRAGQYDGLLAPLRLRQNNLRNFLEKSHKLSRKKYNVLSLKSSEFEKLKNCWENRNFLEKTWHFLSLKNGKITRKTKKTQF